MPSSSQHVVPRRSEGRSQAIAQLLSIHLASESEFYRSCPDFNTALKLNAITVLNNVTCKRDILRKEISGDKMNAQMRRLYHAAELIINKTGQSEVGRVLNESPQVLANWEKRGMSAAGLLNAAAAIGCDAIWLRDGAGDMKPGVTVTGLPAQEIIKLLMLYDHADEVGRSQIMDAASAASKNVIGHNGRMASNDKP